MSLSAEALAQLEDLSLQEARAGLAFVSTAESREPLTADLSSDELSELRNWDLSGVLARLNSLTFEPPPEPELPAAPEPGLSPDGRVVASAREDELPDWLKPAEEAASPAGAEPPEREPAEPGPLSGGSEALPRDQWNQLEDDQRNIDLGEWYRKLQNGEPIEDWQKQALKEFHLWGGGSIPPTSAEEPAVGGPTAEEAGAEGAVADSVAGAGGRMRRFFESEKGRGVLMGAEFAAGGIVGVAIAEILKLGPGQEARIVIVAQSALGLSRLATETGARAVEMVEAKSPRFARLSKELAGEKGLAGVLRGVKTAATRIQYRPFIAGLSVGIIGHSAFEMVTGHSIFPDVNAAEPTPGPAAVNTETPTATATETPTGTPTPDATPVPGGGTGGLPPDERGSEALQPPARQPQPESQFPGGGQPGEAQIPPEDLLPQPGDAELLAAQQAAEAARQTALEAATRVVEVQPGDTLTGLLDAAGSIDPYGADFTNTVLQSADVLTGPQNPHRDMAKALIEFIKAHPGGVNWRDAINGVGDLARQTVGGLPLKDAIAQATRMIYPGQEMKIVVGAGMP